MPTKRYHRPPHFAAQPSWKGSLAQRKFHGAPRVESVWDRVYVVSYRNHAWADSGEGDFVQSVKIVGKEHLLNVVHELLSHPPGQFDDFIEVRLQGIVVLQYAVQPATHGLIWYQTILRDV